MAACPAIRLSVISGSCGGCVRGGWLLGRRVPSLLRSGVVRIVGISSTRSGCRFCRLVGCGIFAGCGGCTWLLRFVLSCVVVGCLVRKSTRLNSSHVSISYVV